jgi:hypothetical protein
MSLTQYFKWKIRYVNVTLADFLIPQLLFRIIFGKPFISIDIA